MIGCRTQEMARSWRQLHRNGHSVHHQGTWATWYLQKPQHEVLDTRWKIGCAAYSQAYHQGKDAALVSLSKTLNCNCFVLQMGRKAVGPVRKRTQDTYREREGACPGVSGFAPWAPSRVDMCALQIFCIVMLLLDANLDLAMSCIKRSNFHMNLCSSLANDAWRLIKRPASHMWCCSKMERHCP